MQATEIGQCLLGGSPQLVARFRLELRQSRQPPRRAPGDGADEVEVLEQLFAGRGGRWGLALQLAPRPQEQQRVAEQARAQGGGALAPGLPEHAHLTRAQLVAGDSRGQGLARLAVGARHRKQVLHGRVSANRTLPDQLLDRHRQSLHQAQPARHPARAAVETLRQPFQVQPEAALQLGEQPALLERRLRLRLPQRAVQQQCLGLAQRPHRGDHDIAVQKPQRAQPLVPVDHHVATRLARRDHDDRHLLATLRQRTQQPTLLRRPPDVQSLVAQVELVELEIQAASVLAPRCTRRVRPLLGGSEAPARLGAT